MMEHRDVVSSSNTSTENVLDVVVGKNTVVDLKIFYNVSGICKFCWLMYIFALYCL